MATFILIAFSLVAAIVVVYFLAWHPLFKLPYKSFQPQTKYQSDLDSKLFAELQELENDWLLGNITRQEFEEQVLTVKRKLVDRKKT